MLGMNPGTEKRHPLLGALVLTALFLSYHWGRGRRRWRGRDPSLFSLEAPTTVRAEAAPDGAAPAWEWHPWEGGTRSRGRMCHSPATGPGRLAGLLAPSCALYQVRGPGDAEQGQGGLPTQHSWSLSLQGHLGHAFTLRDTRHG